MIDIFKTPSPSKIDPEKAVTVSTSPRYKLDKTDLKKLGRTALLAVIGVLIPVLVNWFQDTNFGTMDAAITGIAVILLDAVNRWYIDYKRDLENAEID